MKNAWTTHPGQNVCRVCCPWASLCLKITWWHVPPGHIQTWSWPLVLMYCTDSTDEHKVSIFTPVRCVIILVQNYQQYLSLNYLCHCYVFTNTMFLCYKKCLTCPIILLVHFFCSFLHLSLMQLCCHCHKQGNQTAVAAAYYRKLISMVKMIPYISDYGWMSYLL